MMNRLYKTVLLGAGLLFAFSTTTLAAELPTEKDIQAQLDAAKNDKSGDPKNTALISDLEGTLTLLADINKQKAANEQLKTQIANAADGIVTSKANLDKLKAQSAVKKNDNFTKLSLTDLQTKLAAAQQKIQQIQTELSGLSGNLASQKNRSGTCAGGTNRQSDARSAVK